MTIMKRRHGKGLNLLMLTGRQQNRLTALQLCIAFANLLDQIKAIEEDDAEYPPINDMFVSYRYLRYYGGFQGVDRKQSPKTDIGGSYKLFLDPEFS